MLKPNTLHFAQLGTFNNSNYQGSLPPCAY